MRKITALAARMLTIFMLAAPAFAETITYYVWTDDDGVIHAGDTPPKDRDYETRYIEVNTSTTSAPSPAGDGSRSGGSEANGGGSSSGTTVTRRQSTGVDAAIVEDEQRRLDATPGSGSGGANPAPGAETADPGATAAPAGAGAAGTAAGGGATAPAATIPPAFIGP